MGIANPTHKSARISLWLSQGRQCAICKRRLWSYTEGELDHDHITGLIRGLLCKSCNTKLGNKSLIDCLAKSKKSRHEGVGCDVCDADKVWWRKAYIYIRTQELRQKRLLAFDCVMY